LELLLAASLSALLLVGFYSVFEVSQRSYQAGQVRIQVQQGARLALEVMTADLRLAGYGVPTDPAVISPLLKITAADAPSLTFWADLTNASTILATDVLAGNTVLSVASTAGMKPGDTIYLINGAQWETLSVSAVSEATLTVSSSGAAAFYPQGAQVGRPKLITYAWSAGTGTLSKDSGEGGGPQPLADGIQAFQLRYFDGADVEIPTPIPAAALPNIRRIAMSLTAQGAAGTAAPQAVTVTSAVRPRNL
jgi:hypothetical protein